MMEYSWVVLALTSAFSLATSDALAKKNLEGANEYLVTWFRLLFSLPPLLILLPLYPVPGLDGQFFKAFFIALPVELLTVVLYAKALKVSPLGLSLPFLALTPAFLIVISYLVLGERVSFAGGAGILLITAGSYVLNIGEIRRGFLGPFRAVTREKGSIMMICVALLYTVTSSYGKMAIEHSSPLFFGAAYFVALTFCYTPLALWMGRHELRGYLGDRKYRGLILSGLFNGAMVVTHMTAMKLTKVAYMVSVKRTSLLIGVLYGYVLFGEKGVRQRFLGALLMLAGFVLVVSEG